MEAENNIPEGFDAVASRDTKELLTTGPCPPDNRHVSTSKITCVRFSVKRDVSRFDAEKRPLTSRMAVLIFDE